MLKFGADTAENQLIFANTFFSNLIFATVGNAFAGSRSSAAPRRAARCAPRGACVATMELTSDSFFKNDELKNVEEEENICFL